jgi:hypothetical protein
VKYKYSGIITRQALIDFCQAQLPEIEKKNNHYLEALEYAEKANKPQTVNALEQGLMENYGRVMALRSVCEWAKENMVEDQPIGEEFDFDNVKERLKEKFA